MHSSDATNTVQPVEPCSSHFHVFRIQTQVDVPQYTGWLYRKLLTFFSTVFLFVGAINVIIRDYDNYYTELTQFLNSHDLTHYLLKLAADAE